MDLREKRLEKTARGIAGPMKSFKKISAWVLILFIACSAASAEAATRRRYVSAPAKPKNAYQEHLDQMGLGKNNLVIKNRPAPTSTLIAVTQPLNSSDRQFLSQLYQAVGKKNAGTGAQLAGVINRLNQGQLLNRTEYDFLKSIAGRITGDDSSKLLQIAEKRRDKTW